METKKDLFGGNSNPNFYESYSKEDFALSKMVLDGHLDGGKGLDYNLVDHNNNCLRFYVEKKDEEWMESKKALMKNAILEKGGSLKAQFEHEKSLAPKLI